jgi:hypothetical protein
MVKKVIDIIPPENMPAKTAKPAPDQDYLPLPTFSMGEIPGPENFPLEEKQETKPRLTYINHSNDLGGFKSEKIRQGGGFKGLLWKLGVVVVVVLAVMYAADMKMARAVVSIWPETSVLAEETKIIVDASAKAVDAGNSTVPGLMIMFDDTIKGESPVTTMKDTKGKAQGTVKIFNNYTAEQPLVKGTRLQAPLEKFQPALTKDETPWFRTAESVVIPPKSSVTAKVVSDGSGEKYNIDPSVFSVPGLVGTAKYTFIYAQSFEKFNGGSQGSSPEVAQVDLDNAKAAIVKQADVDIRQRLLSQVPQDFVLMEDTIKIALDTPVVSAKIGNAMAKIPCEVHGKASAVAYRKSDVDSLGKDYIIGKIPTGGRADEKSLELSSVAGELDPVSGKPSLAVSAKVMVYQSMDDTDLKKGLSEKGGKEAEMFLMSQPGMREAKIQLSPVWRFNIPRDLDRIEIKTILD